MPGWSGGVYTRFRNWVSDKANSINPQAANFDQEDDGFAAGLNNCITKDGLNKPSAPMDWNGQSLTGVLNFTNTGVLTNNGTFSLINGKWSSNAAGNLIGAPSSGVALSLTGITNNAVASLISGSAANVSAPDSNVQRAGSTGNTVQQGPNLTLNDTTNLTQTVLQQSGGQTELWQFNGSWVQQWRVTGGIFQARDQAGLMQDIGWRDAPLNSFNANYTTIISDRGKGMQAIASMTFFIAANASVAYPLGAVLTFLNVSGVNISIAINTDTMTLAGTSTTGTRTLANNGIATAIKSGTTTWLISGSGLS